MIYFGFTGAIHKICPRKMPVLRFVSEIPRAEEKPEVSSQNTRLVSIWALVVSLNIISWYTTD